MIYLDAPVVATNPHFFNADPRYGQAIDGLTPNVDDHDVNMDVEFYTGSPLKGGKKLQFNMILRKYDNIGELSFESSKSSRKSSRFYAFSLFGKLYDSDSLPDSLD